MSELIVYDTEESCPYLADRRARMPLRVPLGRLTAAELDRQLASGDRRSGSFLYRPQCPECSACQPLRIDVAQFVPSRSQRRVWRRAADQVHCETGKAIVDEQRVELFNRHRHMRGMEGRDGPIDAHGYRSFLLDSCCATFELRYRVGNQLIGVAICDRGEVALSAVYFFFDPHWSTLSPGVLSILQQIAYCRRESLRYLYLGYYIAESRHMNYKARFRPHERLISGAWQPFGVLVD